MKTFNVHTWTERAAELARRVSESARRVPEELRAPVVAVIGSALIFAIVSLPLANAVPEDAATRAAQAAAVAKSPVQAAAEDAVAKAMAPKATSEPVAPKAEKPAAPASAEKPAAKVAAKPAKAKRPEVVGFYVNWDPESHKSLERNIDTLTIVMPEWYTVNKNARLTALGADKHARVLNLIKQKNPDVRVMPIVNNFGASTDPKMVGRLIAKDGTRKRLAQDIVRVMSSKGYAGVNIDFEGLTAADKGNLVRFMQTLYPIARKAGLEVSQDVLASSATYDYKKLAASTDYLIPMMYDEHWKTSPSGPVSSQGWYERSLRKFFEQVPPNKVIIAMGTYGYDWQSGAGRAKAMTYPKAISKARGGKQPIKLEGNSLNSTFWYKEGGRKHRVWMLDAVSAFNQVKSASRHEPRGYAMWRLGGEDPGLWKVLANRDKLDATVAKSLAHGKRSVQFDAKRGLIVGQRTSP